MKILILGASGMLGFRLLKATSERNLDVYSIVRNKDLILKNNPKIDPAHLYVLDDIKNFNGLEEIIASIQPEVVVNCIGIVKQSHLANDYFESVTINSYLPHFLQKISGKYHFRLIHVSTDCVFDGKKGMYLEGDQPSAYDLYGLSKYLGEVNYDNGITLRTSIIGHELTNTTHGLLEWFLSQETEVKGFTKAIFSGLTTNELSRVILDVVIPNPDIKGLYHVAVAPISKYDLLKVIASVYKKDIDIQPSEDLVLDRSLDASKFNTLTGYQAPSWLELIQNMYNDNIN